MAKAHAQEQRRHPRAQAAQIDDRRVADEAQVRQHLDDAEQAVDRGSQAQQARERRHRLQPEAQPDIRLAELIFASEGTKQKQDHTT